MKKWTKERIDEVFPEIFERISEGESLRSVLASNRERYPSNMTFYEVLDENEELSKQLARAYRAYQDNLTSKMLEIAFNTEEGVITKDTPKGLEVTRGDMTQHRKLKVDTISKVLSLVMPKVGNQNASGDRGGTRYEEEYYD